MAESRFAPSGVLHTRFFLFGFSALASLFCVLACGAPSKGSQSTPGAEQEAPRAAAAPPKVKWEKTEAGPLAPVVPIAQPTPGEELLPMTTRLPMAARLFAGSVVSFLVGERGGYGLPEFALGQPEGCGARCGNTSGVVSLGRGGALVLKFEEAVADGPGIDLIVFENAFRRAGGDVFFEPGEVSLSVDGIQWHTFPCNVNAPAPNGCAGFAPVLLSPEGDTLADDVERAGGDAFDFATLAQVQPNAPMGPFLYVRIVDRSNDIVSPDRFHTACGDTACGFDLDGVVGRYRVSSAP
ncbi:MAG: hypothetical protein IOD12_15450 [Silvanigrellales bacterium]|nr:hypothetical protein [Silvanigrellales bacterium]